MIEHRPERRARTVAWVGLGFQVLLAAFFAVLTVWSESEAMRAVALLSAIGVTIWVFLLLVYHQRVLVQDETFESEQLRRERESGTGGAAIFDIDDEELLLARRRLRWMFRWLLPAFTIAVIVELLAAAVFGWSWAINHSVRADDWKDIENVGMLIWFVGGAAFLSFLLSRYATGMARQPDWRMLRAGASWLMGVTLGAAALVATLAALHFFESPAPERVLAVVLRILLLVLAAEITLNFVLDFYRPRAPEEEPRPAFESRLFGLFSEPGGIARSIADALNYQFGFEVSSTWFYKLMQRSVVPLMGFAVLALLTASSFVFVDTNEQAVIERFGKRQKGVLDPGIRVKWPWPIDTAYKVATSKIHELQIGLEAPPEKNQKKDELILWTNKHAQEPHLEVLVATPKLAGYLNRAGTVTPPGSLMTRPAGSTDVQPAPSAAGDTDSKTGEAVAVSLMRVAVSIQYRIRDAHEWLNNYTRPEPTLKTIANREIIRYCASVDVNGLIGGQRGDIERALQETIQQKADRENLGIEIVFLGLQGVHPPESTAEDFQRVVGAEQTMKASIRAADAESNKRLSEAAGDVERARQLSNAIRELNRIEGSGSSSDVEAARRRLDTLFFGKADDGIPPVGGRAAERVAAARARRWQKENRAHGQAMAFVQEMIAKNAAPEVYRLRKIFNSLSESGDGIRKYVIASEGTLQLNLQDPMSAPLDTALQKQE